MSEDTRTKRKAELAEKRKAQEAIDLDAIDALEVLHGDGNVALIDVPFAPGLVTKVAVRAAKKAEVRRYQARLKEKKPDPTAAAEEVGESCWLYPTGEAKDTLLEARFGLLVQGGVAALGLASGSMVEEGKG